MRSVTASLVGWSGRGPALLAMGCPCRELRTRRVCAACRPIGEALMPLTVPPSLLIVVEVLRPCFTAPSFATMSALVTGSSPGRCGTWTPSAWPGPRGRGTPGARRSGSHRRGGRHPVPPLRQEGPRREVPARRLRQGPGRHRARQLLCDRRCRGGGAVPGPPGLPAGAACACTSPRREPPRPSRPAPWSTSSLRRCPGAPSTWWATPLPRTGLARPARPRHLHHPPGRQRGPAPTRTRAHRQARTPRLEGPTAGHRRRHGRHHHLDPHPGDPRRGDRGRGHGGGHLPVVGSLHRTPIRVVLVRGTSQARPYTLAPATTDLTSTGEQIVARYASRWSSNSRS